MKVFFGLLSSLFFSPETHNTLVPLFILFCFDCLLRIFLDCDRRKQGMGASQSNSYLKYTNDFELVVRATKDLEHLLETEFGAPCGREKGLNDKVLSHLWLYLPCPRFVGCLALSRPVLSYRVFILY